MREIFVFLAICLLWLHVHLFVSVNLHINITWLVVVVFCRLIQLHICERSPQGLRPPLLPLLF